MPNGLVVEDCPVYREVVCQVLRRHIPDLVVEEAEDGSEALHRLRSFKPDVVLLDLHLPGEGGLSLARHIAVTHPLATLMIVTSYDQPEYREAAAQLGIRHFLVKSTATPKQVVARTKQILAERASGEAAAPMGPGLPLT
ncbi:MAG: response regulator transcription factor [Deltaproteobacteria bacterium]|nr:response regulator transcription factor [Deltaproteobacteria bacterium]